MADGYTKSNSINLMILSLLVATHFMTELRIRETLKRSERDFIGTINCT